MKHMLPDSFWQLINFHADDEPRNDRGEADENERQDDLEKQSSRMTLLHDPGLVQEGFQLAHLRFLTNAIQSRRLGSGKRPHCTGSAAAAAAAAAALPLLHGHKILPIPTQHMEIPYSTIPSLGIVS